MIELLSLFAVFIAIFLFGMTVMRTGLYNLSGDKMTEFLVTFTGNPLKGLLVGTVITAIIQSSSAVMVIVVGLVAAGYMTFKQSLGIILGTNIGTTITTELISIQIYDAVVPLLIIGVLCLLSSNRQIFSMGAILFGLGCLFVAMQGFGHLSRPISLLPGVHAFFQHTNENGLLGIGLGTVLTAVIQSSTATTGIVMGFLNEQLLTLHAGIAIILGANIGTCVTAFLASIGASHEAKLTAYAHIWLNIFGVLLFFPFINYLGSLAVSLTALPDMQLAHVSVIFNILTSIVALPLVGLLSGFIMWVHKRA